MKGRSALRSLVICGLMAVLSPSSFARDSGEDARRLPKFADYPVKVMTGSKAPLRLVRNDTDFRTRYRALYQSGPNFAGHYAVAEVGCGTFCSFLLSIDLRTGRTIWLHVPSGEELYICDDEYADENGNLDGGIGRKFHFKPDSRLFVVTGQMAGNECGARYFVEKDGKMIQIREIHLAKRQ